MKFNVVCIKFDQKFKKIKKFFNLTGTYLRVLIFHCSSQVHVLSLVLHIPHYVFERNVIPVVLENKSHLYTSLLELQI